MKFLWHVGLLVLAIVWSVKDHDWLAGVAVGTTSMSLLQYIIQELKIWQETLRILERDAKRGRRL